MHIPLFQLRYLLNILSSGRTDAIFSRTKKHFKVNELILQGWQTEKVLFTYVETFQQSRKFELYFTQPSFVFRSFNDVWVCTLHEILRIIILDSSQQHFPIASWLVTFLHQEFAFLIFYNLVHSTYRHRVVLLLLLSPTYSRINVLSTSQVMRQDTKASKPPKPTFTSSLVHKPCSDRYSCMVTMPRAMHRASTIAATPLISDYSRCAWPVITTLVDARMNILLDSFYISTIRTLCRRKDSQWFRPCNMQTIVGAASPLDYASSSWQQNCRWL